VSGESRAIAGVKTAGFIPDRIEPEAV